MKAVALTVAGSDPCGGAGIQADLKTFHQHGVYGAAVVSLLTVQNTQRLSRVAVQPADLVVAQMEAVLDDIPVSAAKTGALGGGEIVRAVATTFEKYGVRPVVDPVRVSKGGAELLAEDARIAMLETLIPQAALLTPNLDEAEWLIDAPVRTPAQMREAASGLGSLGARAVLIKGGHLSEQPDDLLWMGGQFLQIPGRRVSTRHSHGLGCTLSAAICARLARGEGIVQACVQSKAWLTEALERAPGLGAGQGPVDHLTPVS